MCVYLQQHKLMADSKLLPHFILMEKEEQGVLYLI